MLLHDKKSTNPDNRIAVAYALRIGVRCDSESGPRAGTQYNWKLGCPQCGTGAPVVGTFKLTPSAVPKSAPIASSDRCELFVNQDVRDQLIRRFQASPLDFVRVAARTGGTELPWWLIWPRAVLPPAAVRESKIPIERVYSCNLCDRPGHFDGSVYNFKYAAETWPRTESTPLMRSWEHYGRWATKPPGLFKEFGATAPLVVLRADVASWLDAIARRYCLMVPVTLLWGKGAD